jgi:hypothetical protein
MKDYFYVMTSSTAAETIHVPNWDTVDLGYRISDDEKRTEQEERNNTAQFQVTVEPQLPQLFC